MIQFDEHVTTTTIGELRPGDFIVVVPTQERIRGVQFDSGVKELTPRTMARGRGHSKEIVPASAVRTLRSNTGYIFPNHFTVQVRRMISTIQEG